MKTIGLAITAVSMIARVALAQTPPPPPLWSAGPRPLNIELAAPSGVELKIRPVTIKGEAELDPVTCPPSCALTIYAGRYRIAVEPPLESGLRRVVRTVSIFDDARIAIAPGSRSDHDWGLGLTIGGGIVLGLGMAFFALTHMGGTNPDTATNVATLSMMGVGAPATAGGIYLLVRSRGRVTIDPTWQRSPVPLPSESHLEGGWRF